ncbi:uncharacterized protein LTR77_005298 [Saxophila tyrrhenica]|uniref:Cytochrome P450 n=1 Tax=Saxophila tyrrhenica TaxID=1690608 RepID=A0AAV9P8V8_9PEZI|nr:hypothetical protein LTR77_005298 [Saxophila tyrrhenica]
MALITLALVSFVLYLLGLAFYRLYLSPLAKLPGPKLGALSKFYEAYYEIWRQGKFSFKLDELHERYGPIVRITPEEVHIRDSAFWDTLFVKYPKASRYSSTASRFGNNDSMFAVADAGYHRMLRAPLNPFFSRRAILDQQELVQDKMGILCTGMERCLENGSVFCITDAFAAFAADVISQYSFGFSYGQVEHYENGWKENFHNAYISLGAFGHVSVQYPWVNPLLKSIPDSITTKMDPSLGQMLQLQKDFNKTIQTIKKDPSAGKHHTIFHAVLQSDLPEDAKGATRLEHEAQTVIGGGIVTTAWAATQAIFYILSDDDVHPKLLAELREAVPNPSAHDAFKFEKLEKLPYLTGCVKEGIRFGLGISGRGARVLQEPLVYQDYTIPPGTAISMSARDANFDGSVYKEPRKFRPERWTGKESKLADGSSLDSHFVGFGKGTRMCIGINLAHLELYVQLAQVFRRFQLELYETDTSDVELAHDFFLPSPKLDSKGVRVRVVGKVN